uniref:Uncharacterized protein n=1 Tax=Candidatus Kentrum sp. FW TaxID=2126338 RepID=A0A450T6K4_9GAMM|nr:MAG: hypothetical protein BECKFW1821A_GA0114235_10894 [Candidatus Kentron sp. FW]VFJ62364.1 MAG: hypothetical protein BECKFW1821B_GA0114236_10737 [Candidatus Kentron sp. FW]
MTLTLHGPVAKLVQTQTVAWNYSSPENLIHEALGVLMKQKIDAGIARGLADAKAGRCRELTDDNLEKIAESIVSQSLQ